MFELFMFEALIEVFGNDCLNTDSVLAGEWVVPAIPFVVHIVSTHVPSDLGVFVHTFQFLPLGVAVVFESDGVVGQAVSQRQYPLELAVRLRPRRWFITPNSSLSLSLFS